MKKYTIPKGFHISHIFPSFYRNKPLVNFRFAFTSNCIYNLNDQHNQDCNKLFGVSFGLVHNTSTLWGRIFKKSANSFRIGWNCSSQNGKIQLYAYYYNDGVRKIEYIIEVPKNKEFDASLYFDRIDNKVHVDINAEGFDNSHSVYDFRFKDCPRFGMFLFPYFGGTIAAVHRMVIYLQRLN